MQYSTLIAQIEADIYSNGAELITGDILQTVLKRMVSAWASAGAAYGGTISPDTVVPLSLDQATVYLALTAGTYEHFLDGEGDPIETTGPALVIYDGGPALIFTKTDLPSGGSGATVITGGPGDSLVVTIPKVDEGIKASYRIDMTAAVYGGDVDARYIGSFIIECNELAMQTARGYYYGDDMAEILSEVAIWKDDPEFYPDEQRYYLLLTINANLNEVIFSVSSLDGQSVDADAANKDEKVKVADATISPVGGSSDVFVAEYGVTTYQQVSDAISAGKAVMMVNSGLPYSLAISNASQHRFVGWNHQRKYTMFDCKSNNTWVPYGDGVVEAESNKVSTIYGNETDTTKYPNTKAVADALGKIGVISQTQTWSGSGSNPRTYVMSNPVTGLIPQANIDLFESAGATFNSTTGYFELNGLTDISYEEMQAVYNRTIGIVPNVSKALVLSGQLGLRTNIPIKGTNSFAQSYQYFCYGSTYIEAVSFNVAYLSANNQTTGAFQNCNSLKAIIGDFRARATSLDANMFKNCYSLESLSINGLNASVSFAESSLLTAESVAYMITNAGTAAIAITLHATAYTRAIADASVQAALQSKTNVSLASA